MIVLIVTVYQAPFSLSFTLSLCLCLCFTFPSPWYSTFTFRWAMEPQAARCLPVRVSFNARRALFFRASNKHFLVPFPWVLELRRELNLHGKGFRRDKSTAVNIKWLSLLQFDVVIINSHEIHITSHGRRKHLIPEVIQRVR